MGKTNEVAATNLEPASKSNPPTNIRASKGIPLERIIELRNKKLSVQEIARILCCSEANIVQRLEKLVYEVDLIEPFKKNRANIFAFHQKRILQSINPADLEKANLRDKVISAGILYDKERLETGQSTQNIFFADIVKARDRLEEEKKLLSGQNDERSDTKG